MEISPILMFQLFVSSIVFGLILGFFGDVNHVSRFVLSLEKGSESIEKLYRHPIPFLGRPLRRLKTNKYLKKVHFVVIFFQDLLFFLIAGIGISVLNFTYNDGKNRLYTILGILLGFIFYRIIFEKLMRWGLEGLFFCINVFFSYLLLIFVRPFSKITKFFYKKMIEFQKKILKCLAKRKKRVYNLYVKRYYSQESDFGFLDAEKEK